jgi:hypothetical protein
MGHRDDSSGIAGPDLDFQRFFKGWCGSVRKKPLNGRAVDWRELLQINSI